VKVLLPTMRDPGQIGGTSTHLDMLSAGLVELGHEPYVLYFGEQVPEPLRRFGVVYTAGALNRVRRGWGMIYSAMVRGKLVARFADRELRQHDWQVVNAQEVYSIPALREAADRAGVPLVLTLHGYPLYESVSEGYTNRSRLGRRYLMRSEIRALRLADAIVTVDGRLYRHVLRLVPERADVTYSLMNFIDTSAFSPTVEGRQELRRKWDIAEDKIVLFCPRRLVKKNGVIYPSLALAEMKPPEREKYLLLHAGEGGERGAIEQIVREQGLEAQVRLLGGLGREEIEELYRLCDIVLVPSVHSEKVEEATSLSALEAMASGRPLIAGAVGGLAEMVSDGVNGLLFPGANASALAQAIERLAADVNLRRRLATNARDYVVANHSHLKAASDYVEVYSRARQRLRESLERAETSDELLAASRDSAGSEGEEEAGWPSVSILGFAAHRVTLEEAAEWVLECADESQWERTRLALSLNPELLVRAQEDERIASAVAGADLRFPDGVGAVWASRMQGVEKVDRVPGIELAERILEGAAEDGLSVFFLGAAPGVAADAAARMKQRYAGLDVAGSRHGYFGEEEQDSVVEEVRRSGADILLVALGAPRQELFLHRHRGELGVPVALGVGGSFDVWAGRVRRAPEAFRRLSLEWAYRLVTQPARLRRQLALPRFAYRVLMAADDFGPGRGERLTPAHERRREQGDSDRGVHGGPRRGSNRGSAKDFPGSGRPSGGPPRD